MDIIARQQRRQLCSRPFIIRLACLFGGLDVCAALVRRLSCNFDRRPHPRPRPCPRAFSSPSALSFTLPYQWTLQLARRPILVLFLVVRPPLSGLHRPILNETLATLVSFYPDFPQTPSLRLLSYNETPSL
jgi:hypothetical protein